MSNNYIDNKQFFEKMKVWKDLLKTNLESGDDKPPITEYLGQCFWDIAEHLSRKSNFVNYPFREDMVGDAVENCIMYAHNFDPDKSKNPFSYFTQITYYAFIRRIEKEKKQNFIKYKMLQHLDHDGSVRRWFSSNFSDSDKEPEQQLADHFSLSSNDLEKFKSKKKVKPSEDSDTK